MSLENVPDWPELAEQLRHIAGQEIEIDEHLGALSLIGEGINKDNRNLIRAIEVLEAQNITTCGITTTSFRISFLIKRVELGEAVRACHKAFIENVAVCRTKDGDPTTGGEL